jgi:ribose transport system substrate-binding protein
MKKMLKFAVVAMLFGLLASCARDNAGGGSGGKEVRVAFSQCQSSDPWRIAETNDVMRAAKEHGYDLIYTDAQGDTSKQISDVEDIIAQGVDYLIYDGREFEASAAALDIAKKAGVKVILIDRLVRGTAGVDYITYIGTDFIWEGQACAEWVIANTNGKARIVEIYGTPGSSAAEDRHKGFADAIAGSSGIEIIVSQTGDFSRSDAQQVVENAIQSTQGQFDVIFAHNDEMGMGAIQALKSAGIQPGKDILVVSIDGQQDAVKAVIAGELGCTVTCNPHYGDITFETLDKIIAGETVSQLIILDDVVIDSSNAEERLPLAH